MAPVSIVWYRKENACSVRALNLKGDESPGPRKRRKATNHAYTNPETSHPAANRTSQTENPCRTKPKVKWTESFSTRHLPGRLQEPDKVRKVCCKGKRLILPWGTSFLDRNVCWAKEHFKNTRTLKSTTVHTSGKLLLVICAIRCRSYRLVTLLNQTKADEWICWFTETFTEDGFLSTP